jgi:hypothetical protein
MSSQSTEWKYVGVVYAEKETPATLCFNMSMWTLEYLQQQPEKYYFCRIVQEYGEEDGQPLLSVLKHTRLLAMDVLRDFGMTKSYLLKNIRRIPWGHMSRTIAFLPPELHNYVEVYITDAKKQVCQFYKTVLQSFNHQGILQVPLSADLLYAVEKKRKERESSINAIFAKYPIPASAPAAATAPAPEEDVALATSSKRQKTGEAEFGDSKVELISVVFKQ